MVGAAPALVVGDITDAGAVGEAIVQAETAAEVLAELGVSGDPGLPASGLVALWRASSLSLADGDPVATWAPASGSPGSLTGSGSARPTYRATGSPSGGPCVEFDGSDDYLSLETPAGLPDGADAGTLVALVARCPAGGSGYDHLVQFGAAANLGARGLAYAGDQWVTVDWASNLAGESTSPRTAAAVVLGHSYDGTTRRLWLDGNPIARDTPSLATGTTRLVVGRNLTGGYGGEHAAFRLVFVAIYSTALTEAQWAQVMAHARAAHGVR